MKAIKAVEEFRRLRKRTAWDLLAAINAPEVLGILKTHLYDKERRLPASVFLERVGMDLEDMRARGDNWPSTSQQYVHYWLTNGYLERKLAPGAIEEDYELTPGAMDAIRFVIGMDRTQNAATESRLSLVITALSTLADETNTDKASRLDRLEAEKERIQNEMDSIEKGHMRVLAHDVAVERTREIILLASDLTGDFRHVRDKYFHLHQDLREKIMSHEGGRGVVLEETFAGLHAVKNSEPGRTFAAFWALLTDPLQAAMLDSAVDEIMSRSFAQKIDAYEQRFLRNIKKDLLKQNEEVQKEFNHFRTSLTNYVKSSDYLEQRRLNNLIREAQRAAMAMKNDVKPYSSIPFNLALTTSQLSSLAQIKPLDASKKSYGASMEEAPPSEFSLLAFKDELAMSEIDFRTLENNVVAVMAEREQASIGDVLQIFPAKQGLGSVLGLLELGCRIGVTGEHKERVTWTGMDGIQRTGNIPAIYFIKGRLDELVQ